VEEKKPLLKPFKKNSLEMEPYLMATKTEVDVKLDRIYKLLDQTGAGGLLLQQSSNFAWATCGAESYINRADLLGIASLLITPSKRYVVTNNIEAGRLSREEGLEDQKWEFQVAPWYEQNNLISSLIGGKKLVSDFAFPGASNLSQEVASLRYELTPEEGNRYRELAGMCAQGMKESIEAVRPGMTEYELAGILSQNVESKGVQVIVNLIATDERISSFRHPLPAAKKLEKYAMLIVCGRKWGLICSVTRLVHFGKMPDELRRKAEAVARIDAEMTAATRPGKTLGDVFKVAQAAYALTGFPDEWQKHHQGGSAGYAPREVTATPGSTQPILAGQVFAWNPSITGAKSEDTILIGAGNNEVLTEMAGWPSIEVKVGNQVIKRPAVLEKN
jgi:antitoxin VapB